MRTVVAVGVAGFVGALARYELEGLIADKTTGSFPWGTMFVNVAGSFVLGLLFALLVEGRVVVAPWLRTAAMVGLIGTYTTFSTFALKTVRLAEDGSYVLAGVNAMGSLAIGLVAASAGIALGRVV
jgi:fluoride exporter